MKKMAVPVILLLAMFSILGCVAETSPNNTNANNIAIANNNTNNMTNSVVAGDKVSVEYTGTFENGTIFDSSVGRAPLEFTAGAGQMIKGFDAAVIGMHVGEEKTVSIKPEDAYGTYDASNVIEVPLAELPEGTKAGDTLYASGRPVIVKEIRNSTAVIDVNHPLAGKTLVFKIKLLSIG